MAMLPPAISPWTDRRPKRSADSLGMKPLVQSEGYCLRVVRTKLIILDFASRQRLSKGHKRRDHPQ